MNHFLGEVCRVCKLSDKILLLNGSKKIETNGHWKVHPRLKVLASVFLHRKHMLFVTLAFCIFNLCDKCHFSVGHVFLCLHWDENSMSTTVRLWPESIEWFIEDQTFSPSYDLAPYPSPFSKLSLSIPGVSSATVEGVAVREEPNHTAARTRCQQRLGYDQRVSNDL